MDCQKLDETLYELVSGSLEASARAQCEAHAGGCARCASEIAAYRATVHLMEVTRNPQMPDSFWDRQRTRIMEAVSRALATRPWKAQPLSLGLLMILVAGYIIAGLDAMSMRQHEVTLHDGGSNLLQLTLIPIYGGLLALALYSFREKPARTGSRPN